MIGNFKCKCSFVRKKKNIEDSIRNESASMDQHFMEKDRSGTDNANNKEKYHGHVLGPREPELWSED